MLFYVIFVVTSRRGGRWRRALFSILHMNHSIFITTKVLAFDDVEEEGERVIRSMEKGRRRRA